MKLEDGRGVLHVDSSFVVWRHGRSSFIALEGENKDQERPTAGKGQDNDHVVHTGKKVKS